MSNFPGSKEVFLTMYLKFIWFLLEIRIAVGKKPYSEAQETWILNTAVSY